MGAHRTHELNTADRRLVDVAFTWLGGGDTREIGERHERSAHVIAGVVVLLTALLGGVVAGLAVGESTVWPVVIVISVAVAAAALTGVLGRAIASGAPRGRLNIGGRAAVGIAVGVVLGELAAVVLFAGASQRLLEEQAAARAETVPAVSQVAAQLDQSRQERVSLIDGVDQARRSRDDALVVARCEYNPRPNCPQTHITGDAGDGPETRTANDFLADAQREFDAATADRDRRLPGLDSQISHQEQTLAAARQSAIAAASPGLGARWVAMNDYTSGNAGAMTLRVLVSAFFVFLSLLPLVLKVWRGETTQDRQLAARVEQQRAELDAETAIAIKRAEVRAETEKLWAEQELESARLAVAAQNEIEREQQRRRVFEAVGVTSVAAQSERLTRPAVGPRSSSQGDDLFLPIAAEAEAASRGLRELPAAVAKTPESDSVAMPKVIVPAGSSTAVSGEVVVPESLPAQNLPERVEQVNRPVIPGIPDVTQAAARWIRPFVPPIVAQAFDVATHPLRSARQVFEEVEEINLTLNRTRKVAVYTEEAVVPPYAEAPYAQAPYEQPYYEQPYYGETVTHASGWVAPPAYGVVPPVASQYAVAAGEYPAEIPAGDVATELPGPTGPWQLPPGS